MSLHERIQIKFWQLAYPVRILLKFALLVHDIGNLLQALFRCQLIKEHGSHKFFNLEALSTDEFNAALEYNGGIELIHVLF